MAAVEFGSAGGAALNNHVTAPSTAAWAHVVASDDNLIIVTVGLGLNVALPNGNDKVSSSTFTVSVGGVPMTLLAYAFRTAVYYLKQPPVGSKSMQVTMSAGYPGTTFVANSMTFKNVGKIKTPVTSDQTGTSHTVTVADGVKDGMVVFGVGTSYSGNLNSYSGANLAHWNPTVGNHSVGGFYVATTGPGNKTVTAASSSSNWGGTIGFALEPASNGFFSMF